MNNKQKEALDRKLQEIRTQFIDKYSYNINSEKECSANCSKVSKIWAWHWTGFTFHLECLPEVEKFKVEESEELVLSL